MRRPVFAQSAHANAHGHTVTWPLGRRADAPPEVAADPVPTPITLVLIDDNRLLRDVLAAMIQSAPGFGVSATFAGVNEALEKVRQAKRTSSFWGFGVADHDSLSLTARIRAEVPAARVIVMGLLPTRYDVANYVGAAASGFIM